MFVTRDFNHLLYKKIFSLTDFTNCMRVNNMPNIELLVDNTNIYKTKCIT